jgi:hypothetical protein
VIACESRYQHVGCEADEGRSAAHEGYTTPSWFSFPFLFPFSYKVTKEQLMENEDYTLATFDSTLSVSLKAPDFR